MPTKSDKTGHSLTVVQLNAVDLLVTGATDAETAEAVGASRQTVNAWKNHDAAFIAALNARRLDVWGGACDRMRALLPKAIDALDAALTRGDPDWRAAVRVLELAGLDRSGPGQPNLGPAAIGPTTPKAVIAAEAHRRSMDTLGDLFVSEIERRAVQEEWRGRLALDD